MYAKTLHAGWADMDFNAHRTPPALLSAMTSLEKTGDFVVLPSNIKARV
jgi:hypothetical protein